MAEIATTWQMWFALAVILAAVVGYASDRASLETVSGGVLSILLLVFHFAPVLDGEGEVALGTAELLAGFASPALFAILGLLIVGQGMYQSGALEYPTRLLLDAYDKFRLLAVLLVFLFVMVVSAFLNNTPVVVMFVPIMAAMATQAKIAPSRLMMPLSFLSILGGMTTTIGSSTNLLAVAEYQVVTGTRLSFFALTPLGLILAGVGAVYLAFAAKFWLPDRRGGEATTAPDGRQFVAQLTLERGNPLIGQVSVAGFFPDLPDLTVRMVQRGDEVLLPPFDGVVLQLNDKVIVAATRGSLTDLLRKRPQILQGFMAEVEVGEGASGELTMVEAVVAPGSRIIGRTISQIRFRFQTNCVIIGIQRRSRMIRTEVAHIRLEAGDVLLILGDRSDVRSLRSDRDILMLEQSMQQLPDPDHARYAGLIFLLVVCAASTGFLPISIAAILGATAMVGTGCLNVRQASRAVDRRVYLLVGTALALGAALDRTGGAAFLASYLTPLATGPGGTTLLLSAFFAMTAALTNVLSNNATVVLFTPIAVSAAQSAGIDPLVLVLTVIYAANCSFATPIAYQTNLLVMGPGHYRFRDFVVVGGPLIVLLWVLYTVVAPPYFRAVGLL
ncbi:SLC13 family permease [Parvularcula dongshanensis]|uniref:Di/tricarboxylate transporter n=1 Tax=Parvularcula dongshanensis TaxID=1173995 RepID=A0A840I0L7_9PROT|nr:SLC13 family permease [Parvularcula dongshanensis]MBB4658606.1 di/tricarboxylate transporter [Parvularcula dongshanensis]